MLEWETFCSLSLRRAMPPAQILVRGYGDDEISHRNCTPYLQMQIVGTNLRREMPDGVAEINRQEAKKLIRHAGLRATAPRVAVLRLLASSPKPLSHSEVIQALGEDEWDQATLYRNLLKLVEVNLARVASQMGGVIRYEARVDDDPHVHPHFSCQICGKVECLPGAKLAGSVELRWHPSLVDSQLQVVGNCPECLEAKARGEGQSTPKGNQKKSTLPAEHSAKRIQRKTRSESHASK